MFFAVAALATLATSLVVFGAREDLSARRTVAQPKGARAVARAPFGDLREVVVDRRSGSQSPAENATPFVAFHPELQGSWLSR